MGPEAMNIDPPQNQNAEQPTMSLMDLNNECLRSIACHLPSNELSAMASTCQRWRTIARTVFQEQKRVFRPGTETPVHQMGQVNQFQLYLQNFGDLIEVIDFDHTNTHTQAVPEEAILDREKTALLLIEHHCTALRTFQLRHLQTASLSSPRSIDLLGRVKDLTLDSLVGDISNVELWRFREMTALQIRDAPGTNDAASARPATHQNRVELCHHIVRSLALRAFDGGAQLTKLHLHICDATVNLLHLNRLSTLKKLYLMIGQATLDAAEVRTNHRPLAHVQKFVLTTFNGETNGKIIPPFLKRSVNSLVTLNLHRCLIDWNFLEHLRTYQHLNKLKLDVRLEPTLPYMNLLGFLPQLQSPKLQVESQYLNYYRYQDEQEAPHESLTFHCTHMIDQLAVKLLPYQNLVHLNMNITCPNGKIPVQSLKHLRHLRKLIWRNDINQFYSPIIQQLGATDTLQQLVLTNCLHETALFVAIAQFRQLKEIVLNNIINIDNDDLIRLHELRKLERLVVHISDDRIKLSWEELIELIERLPRLQRIELNEMHKKLERLTANIYRTMVDARRLNNGQNIVFKLVSKNHSHDRLEYLRQLVQTLNINHDPCVQIIVDRQMPLNNFID